MTDQAGLYLRLKSPQLMDSQNVDGTRLGFDLSSELMSSNLPYVESIFSPTAVRWTVNCSAGTDRPV